MGGRELMENYERILEQKKDAAEEEMKEDLKNLFSKDKESTYKAILNTWKDLGTEPPADLVEGMWEADENE